MTMPAAPAATVLRGRRVQLRPVELADFDGWREVRRRCADWLLKWEPAPPPGQTDITDNRQAFAARCGARRREWQLGTGYGFGIFVDDRFTGEINVNSVQRGPFQNAYVGYWIDQAQAGNGFVPEALVAVARFAFEDLALHRLQVAIIPRNQASRRGPIEQTRDQCAPRARHSRTLAAPGRGNQAQAARRTLTRTNGTSRQILPLVQDDR